MKAGPLFTDRVVENKDLQFGYDLQDWLKKHNANPSYGIIIVTLHDTGYDLLQLGPVVFSRARILEYLQFVVASLQAQQR